MVMHVGEAVGTVHHMILGSVPESYITRRSETCCIDFNGEIHVLETHH